MAAMLRLVVIGLAAGLFSALFGVGGGIIVVPLLLIVERFKERPAMATSLVAIVVIAAVGSISYAVHGEVKPGAAVLIGLPGAVGAVAGARLQQRVSTRWLSLGFAAVLVGVAVQLLIS
jgi:uncharacterized protein